MKFAVHLPVILLLAPLAVLPAPDESIDHHALVTRHNIEWSDLRGQIPLGNGEFCINESPLLRNGNLVVALDFPYPSANSSSPWVGDWNRPGLHASELILRAEERRADIQRAADAATYYVRVAWTEGCALTQWCGETSRKKLAIVSARCGNGDSWLDVTQKLAAAARDNRLALTPSFEDGSFVLHWQQPHPIFFAEWNTACARRRPRWKSGGRSSMPPRTTWLISQREL